MKVADTQIHWSHHDGYVSVQGALTDEQGRYKKLTVYFCHADGVVWDMTVIEGELNCTTFMEHLKPAKIGDIFDTLRELVDSIREGKHSVPEHLIDGVIAEMAELK